MVDCQVLVKVYQSFYRPEEWGKEKSKNATEVAKGNSDDLSTDFDDFYPKVKILKSENNVDS